MQRSSTTGRFQVRRDPVVVRSAGCAAVALAAAHLIAGVAAPEAKGQAPKPTEYEVKAAYLIDFGKFVRASTPQQSRSSFDICVLGRDSFGQSLSTLASNETIDHL